MEYILLVWLAVGSPKMVMAEHLTYTDCVDRAIAQTEELGSYAAACRPQPQYNAETLAN